MYIKILVGGLCSLIISVLIAPPIIKLLKRFKAGQVILEYVEQHKSKGGTPTMGGFIFIIPTVIFTLAFDCSESTLVVVLTTLGYMLLGFLDDYIKIKYHHNEGLKPYQKIIGQGGIAIIVSLYCYNNPEISSSIILPFTNGKTVDLGLFYPFLVFFAFVATSNAVNLVDGLDGLAGSVGCTYFIFYTIISIVLLNEYSTSGDVMMQNQAFGQALFAFTFACSLIGYLCYNHYPASVMMGDTGSLAMGGAVCTVAVFTKTPLLILLVGIMFVVTCISIIMQVVHYKRTKKRIFLMSPLHHHFEKKGYGEGKIGICYVAVTVIGGLLSLISM